jgi:hypothetical protein
VHGPPLSSAEVIARLARHIARLEAIGLSRDAAVAATAAHYNVDARKVAALVAGR